MAARKSNRDRETQAPPPLMGRHGPPGASKIERAKDTRGTTLRLWSYLRRQRGALVATALMVVVTTVPSE